MPSKRNQKKHDKHNKQKHISLEPNDASPEPQIDIDYCLKSGFTVIPNTGITVENRERYTNSCFFRSICDFLTLDGRKLTAIKIRQSVSFPKLSIEVDTIEHSHYIQAVCNLYNLSIAFFTVNIDQKRNYSSWIGNPGVIFTSKNLSSSYLSIASYGSHYELIVSKTPFSKDFKHRCKHYKLNTHTYYYDES